ncbi:MAG TPA: Fe-S protein assembly co-chaperone HscB [Acidisarcina sp.]
MRRAEQNSAITACWSCAAPLAGARLVCEACGKIQPPSVAATYFQVFGLPEKLHIDLPALESSFHRLSRKLHPDINARASSEEQQWSLVNTSLLNDAYRTLKMPLSRTEYVLQLEGVELGDGSGASDSKAKQARTPPDLLEEVFELNMQLEEMRMNRNVGEEDLTLREDLRKAKENFEAQLAAADHSLEELWTRWDASLEADDQAGKTEAKERLTTLLDRRRYVQNLVRDVNEAIDE